MFPNMIAYLKKRKGSDRGDSTAVSFILIFPIFFSILMTIIDTSVFFANRTIVSNLSRDAVRQAAIVGGPGTAEWTSQLQATYGFNACTPKGGATLRNGTQVECLLENKLASGSGLVAVDVSEIHCWAQSDGNSLATYNLTGRVGTPIYCEVDWEYAGIPGSVLGFIQNEGESPFQVNKTKTSTQSEVGLDLDDVRSTTP